jgi:hypothetical protein
MKSDYVVGYSLNAENYCDECMRKIALKESLRLGAAMMWGDSGTAEDVIEEWASYACIDRMDETSYDSSEFPKVIFSDQAHDGCSADNGYAPGQCGDACCNCHNPIGYDCPNIEKGW